MRACGVCYVVCCATTNHTQTLRFVVRCEILCCCLSNTEQNGGGQRGSANRPISLAAERKRKKICCERMGVLRYIMTFPCPPESSSRPPESSPRPPEGSPKERGSSPNERESSPNERESSPTERESSPNERESSPNERGYRQLRRRITGFSPMLNNCRWL
jgi:hypothetical protein